MIPVCAAIPRGEASLRELTMADTRLALADVGLWPFASFRCAVEFGRNRGIADSGKSFARQIYGFTA
jgi:hypothetical protein